MLNQKGAIPLLILIAAVGIIGTLAVTNLAPFNNNLLSTLFPINQSFAAAAPGTIAIDPSIKYQTILGWGASSDGDKAILNVSPVLRDIILDDAVEIFGFNRLRYFPNFYSPNNWEPINDNNDPNTINWAGFNTAWHDQKINEIILPLKQRVEAKRPGEKLSIYISFNFDSAHYSPSWLLSNPSEYSENIIAIVSYLKQKNITVDHVVIQNEPSSSGGASPALHASVIKDLGPKMQAQGFPTKVQFVDGINASTTMNYINSLQSDSAVWPHIGLLSYHYYGTLDPFRSQIRDFGISWGIPTGQTENCCGSSDAKFQNLIEDLILGGTSIWEANFGFANLVPSLGGYNLYAVPASRSEFGRSVDFWKFRQITYYARPGAKRIEASSGVSGVNTVAFLDKNNKPIVVASNTTTTAQSVDIVGLTPGSYGVSQSVNGARTQELGIKSVTASTLTVNIPASTVLTVYPYAGINLPPIVLDVTSNPTFLKTPSSTVTLNAQATDIELDPINYSWSVKSKPAAASVTFSAANAQSTQANGLTVAGQYVFTVTAASTTLTDTKEVLVTVYSGNQPPFIVQQHNRNPSVQILPTNTSTELRVFAMDLESGTTLNYTWSLLSQPSGANATIATPTSTSGTTVVSNMTVAGDYDFRLAINDGTNTATFNRTVTVYAAGTIASPGPSSTPLPSASPSLSPSPSVSPSPSPSPSPKSGDVNGNTIVDIFDHNILVGNFAQSGPITSGNLDGVGKIDIQDYNILLTGFGR